MARHYPFLKLYMRRATLSKIVQDYKKSLTIQHWEATDNTVLGMQIKYLVIYLFP